jgi:diacylglycerol kinase (ATP)
MNDAFTPRRILVVHNPTAGRRRDVRLEGVIRAMRALGAKVDVHPTAHAGDAEATARDHEGDYDVIVASGGDGTVNEVINGLAARADGLHVPALGILPLGTANLLARELGYPRAGGDLGLLLALGKPTAIHIGECNGRRFTLMAGAGFDGGVVDRVDLGLKRRFGRLAYALQAARELLAYDPDPCFVSVDGGPPIRAWSVVVAKGRRYGGRFHLARDADVRDPDLHVCLFERPGRIGIIATAVGMVLGLAHRVPGYRVVRGSHVTVTGAEASPVQVDGDRGWRLPIDVRTSPIPLSVVAP